MAVGLEQRAGADTSEPLLAWTGGAWTGGAGAGTSGSHFSVRQRNTSCAPGSSACSETPQPHYEPADTCEGAQAAELPCRGRGTHAAGLLPVVAEAGAGPRAVGLGPHAGTRASEDVTEPPPGSQAAQWWRHVAGSGDAGPSATTLATATATPPATATATAG